MRVFGIPQTSQISTSNTEIFHATQNSKTEENPRRKKDVFSRKYICKYFLRKFSNSRINNNTSRFNANGHTKDKSWFGDNF